MKIIFFSIVNLYIETKEIRNIIQKMLEKEPTNRITSSRVVNLLIIKIPKIGLKKVKKKTQLNYFYSSSC
jgi:hypothetical protein